jgi:hypothetical protein
MVNVSIQIGKYHYNDTYNDFTYSHFTYNDNTYDT